MNPPQVYEGWNGEGGGKRVQDGEHMYLKILMQGKGTSFHPTLWELYVIYRRA